MRPGQRISISLLLTVVIFTVFTFLAYSGLFNYIETTIYNSRVSASIQSDLEAKARVIKDFHQGKLASLNETFSDPIFWQIYRNNESQELIREVGEAGNRLREQHPGYLGFRFIDPDGKIWYSSFPGDLREASATRRVYYLWADVEPETEVGSYIVYDTPAYRLDPAGQRFAYLIPITNTIDEYQGTLVVYLGYSSLLNTMAARNVLEAGRSSLLAGEGLYLFNSGILPDEQSAVEIARLLENHSSEPEQRTIGESGESLFTLFSRPAEDQGLVAYIVSMSQLQLTMPLQILLLTLVFLTIFLIIFLIMSFRQDDMSVISERIKRFQYGFLKEYINKSDDIDLSRWRADLQNQQEAIKKRLLKGIRKAQLEKASEAFDQNWKEVIDLLTPDEKQSSQGLDMRHLEQILEKVLERQRHLESSIAVAPVQAKSQPRIESKPADTVQEPEALEEIEEAETLDEAGDPEEVEELDEAGDLEEIEELDEAGDLEEVEELDEAEDLEEAEELDEAGDLEEVEELDEAEDLEEAEELDQVDEIEAVEDAETDDEPEALEEMEEAEPLDEAGDLEEVEELDEAGDLEEAEELDEAGDLEEAEELDEAEDLEEVEELDEVDEIEAVEKAEPTEEPTKTEIPELVYQQEEFELVRIDQSEELQSPQADDLEEPEVLEEVEEIPEETGLYSDMFFADEDAFDLEALFRRPEDLGDIGVFEDAYEEELAEELDELEDESLEEPEAAEEPIQTERDFQVEELAEPSDEELSLLSAAKMAHGSSHLSVRPLETEPFEILEELPEIDAVQESAELQPLDLTDRDGLAYRSIDRDFSYAPVSAGVGALSLHEDMPSQLLLVGTVDSSKVDELATQVIVPGTCEVYPFFAFLPREEKVDEAIEERDGVFRIRDEVYSTLKIGEKKEFKELVDSVLKSESGDESIDSIFSSGSVDLGFASLGDESLADKRLKGGKPLDQRLLVPKGFNYDLYLHDFREGHIGIMKSLMRVSAQFNAVHAAILGFDEEGLNSQYTLGMDETGNARLHFSKDEDLFPLFLDYRIIYLTSSLSGIPFFDQALDERGKHFIEGHLFLPVILREFPAYIYLALKMKRPQMDDYIKILNGLI